MVYIGSLLNNSSFTLMNLKTVWVLIWSDELGGEYIVIEWLTVTVLTWNETLFTCYNVNLTLKEINRPFSKHY